MGRPTDYSSPQRQGLKVPQVHMLEPFVMLKAESAALLHDQIRTLRWKLCGSRHSAVPKRWRGTGEGWGHTHAHLSCLISAFKMQRGWLCGVQ